jgi:hypothetical protein
MPSAHAALARRCSGAPGSRLNCCLEVHRDSLCHPDLRPAPLHPPPAGIGGGGAVRVLQGPLNSRQRFVCATKECRAAYGADYRREAESNGVDGWHEDSRATVVEAELVEDLRASTARLAVQLDGFRGRVLEFVASVLVGDAR